MTNVAFIGNAAQNPDNVLQQAVGEYERVFVIGYDHDGRLDVRASTNVCQADILWMVEMFKQKLMAGEYGDFD